MHDVLEGCLPYEMKEMFKVLIAEKILSLSDLNNAVQSFHYGSSDIRNKPALISPQTMKNKDHALKQTGNLLCVQLFLLHVHVHVYSFTMLVPGKIVASYYWTSCSY